MATKTSTQFVINMVKAHRRKGEKCDTEVDRMMLRVTLRDSENGVSASVYLHFLDGGFVAYPVEPKPEKQQPS